MHNMTVRERVDWLKSMTVEYIYLACTLYIYHATWTVYHNESLVAAARAADPPIDYHELGVVGIFFQVSEQDNPAFDAIFTMLDEIQYPTANIDNETDECEQLSFNLRTDLDINDLIPNGLAENGFFAYEGSLTTPPCTTDARWYLMKVSISV